MKTLAYCIKSSRAPLLLLTQARKVSTHRIVQLQLLGICALSRSVLRLQNRSLYSFDRFTIPIDFGGHG